jgi:hypothetical protein
VLDKKGTLEIGVVAYKVENEQEIQRYNPSPDYFESWVGSLKDAENSEPITPSDKEQMEQAIQEMETKVDNLDIDAEKEEHKTTITITKKDGTTKEVEVLDGQKGEKGDKGDAGAIKFEIVQELPTTDIKEDTIYLVPYSIITVQELPITGQSHTIYIVESTNKRYVYESSQWIEISSDNKYIEYIYVNNQWEELGRISVDVDLSDYYTKQETNDLLDNKQDEITQTNKLDYSLLDNTPTIPSKTSDLTNDSDFTTKTYVDNIVGDIESILETLDIGNGV